MIIPGLILDILNLRLIKQLDVRTQQALAQERSCLRTYKDTGEWKVGRNGDWQDEGRRRRG